MEIEIYKDIQTVVLGFQSALYVIEDDLKNKELAGRMRELFNDTMKELLPTKAFAYVEDSDEVSIFDDEETRDNCIDLARRDFETSTHINEDDEFNFKPISYEEFKELFGDGDNPDLYTAIEGTGELIYSVA